MPDPKLGIGHEHGHWSMVYGGKIGVSMTT